MFGQTNSIYIVTVKLYKISKPGLTNVRPGFFCLLNLGMRQRWRVGLVCKTSGFHLSGFDSHQPHKKGSYTVGVAGSTVNALSSDSGGSTPSLPTK
jgi:hypothetical protein